MKTRFEVHHLGQPIDSTTRLDHRLQSAQRERRREDDGLAANGSVEEKGHTGLSTRVLRGQAQTRAYVADCREHT